MFDTKIAIVRRNDLAMWQKLNVTAFLTSGIVGANPGILGEPYEDAAGNTYSPLVIQPIIVLSAGRDGIQTIWSSPRQKDIHTASRCLGHDRLACGPNGEVRNRVAIHIAW